MFGVLELSATRFRTPVVPIAERKEEQRLCPTFGERSETFMVFI
jgi:hypothetical protein